MTDLLTNPNFEFVNVESSIPTVQYCSETARFIDTNGYEIIFVPNPFNPNTISIYPNDFNSQICFDGQEVTIIGKDFEFSSDNYIPYIFDAEDGTSHLILGLTDNQQIDETLFTKIQYELEKLNLLNEPIFIHFIYVKLL